MSARHDPTIESTDDTDRPLLEIRDVSVEYRRRRDRLVAVDGVSLEVARGRTLGLVGESGSGKSTIGSAILGLVAPSDGELRFDGEVLSRRRRTERVELSRRIQAVFQDPYGSMNPTQRIGTALAEPLKYSLRLGRDEIEQRVARVLADVGMDADVVDRYPAQFSGGQLQRLAIARALAVEPEFIVCDEAVSALDLSVQAQVVNLFAGLAAARGLSYLFISHDLTVVAHLSDDIVVLFAGQVMEHGPAEVVARRPGHPYTQNLVLSAPVPDAEQQALRRRSRVARAALHGAVRGVDPRSLVGCPYAARCPLAIGICATERPPLLERDTGVSVACHRYGEIVDPPEEAVDHAD